MHDDNARITFEIIDVESEQVSNSVYPHRSDEACIMNLRPKNRVNQYQAPPFRKDALVIRPQAKRPLDSPNPLVCLLRRKSVSVPVARTRANIPEFKQVLRDVTQALAATFQNPDGLPHDGKFGIVGIDESHQDVCVSQVHLAGHQSWSW